MNRADTRVRPYGGDTRRNAHSLSEIDVGIVAFPYATARFFCLTYFASGHGGRGTLRRGGKRKLVFFGTKFLPIIYPVNALRFASLKQEGHFAEKMRK